MNSLDNFLEKIRNALTKVGASKDPLISIIKQETGIELPSKDILLKDTVAYIQSKPIVRNEIFMHKKNIIDKLKATGVSDIRDIR